MEKYIPKIGENYYYISHCVGCEPSILRRQNCDSLDKTRISEGNCYKTKKQAEIALKSYKEEWLKTHEDLILKESDTSEDKQDETNKESNISEDYKNLKEIIDLCKEELKNNNQDITAVLDIIDLKSLNNILSEYKRMLKENEELREYYEEQNEVNAKFIPVQKIKDKIELLEEKAKYEQNFYLFIQLYKQIKVLKELLKEEK